MIIVTTPMCEKILEFAGIKDYKVNKHPDDEKGDLAILLSENKTKMNSLNIKLNTFSQIRDRIIEVSKFSKFSTSNPNNNDKGYDDHSDLDNEFLINNKEIKNIFSNYEIANEWLNVAKKEEFKKKNSKINVKVYSKFLKDIVTDMGFNITNSNHDYIIYPDYMDIKNNKIQNSSKYEFISIPTHGNVSKDPILRAEIRYSILNKLL